MERPKLTHVAIRFQGTIYSLPAPNRHHHVIRHIVETTGATSVDVDMNWDQGFLDANGTYLSRKQAQVNAELNGQIKGGKTIGMMLTSEDLW